MKVRTLVLAAALYSSPIVSVTPALALTVDDARLVQSVVDPSTGREVRVLVGGAADLTIEVGDGTVRIQKQLIGRTAFTRLVTPTERLTIAVDAQRVMVDGTLGHAEATPGQQGTAVRGLLARSDAVSKAIAFLGRMNLGTRSAVGHTLFSTRVMLLSELGDSRGQEELSRWIRTARQAISVTRAGFQTGPGDCWKAYEAEALAIAAELDDCLKGVKWYEVGREFICGSIYDLQAVGAMSWYLHCVALR